MTWMRANRAEELAKVDAATNRREAGSIQAKLCKEYGESLKAAPTATPMLPTPAPSSDLVKLAMAFQDAFNQRDLDTALGLLVDDGLVFIWDGGKTDSKQSVRDWLEYMIGRGTELSIADCAPKGKALGCVLEWRDDYGVKAWTGLDVARYDLTVNARDNKIQLFSMMSSAETVAAFNEFYPKFRDWAEANRLEEWKQVFSPGAYDLAGRPLGELESRLCKEYLEATKQ